MTPTDIAEILSEELHPLPGTDDDQQDEMYEHFSLTVDKGQALLRIDKFLTNRMEGASRNRIQTAADAGTILVNGTPVKSSYKVKPLDRISIVMPYPVREIEIIPENIPLDIRYEDDDLIVIRDIEPKAKLHYLCIPKEHFALLSEMDEGRAELLKRCFQKISDLQKQLGLEDGYRIIVNQGENGGQTVLHLHIHVLGGERLTGF